MVASAFRYNLHQRNSISSIHRPEQCEMSTSNNSTVHTLVAKDLHKAYKKRRVLEGVSMSVSSGDIVGLLGPNGAGKTTCFYMVVGLVKPDQGQILFDDTDITAHPMHARARLGVGYLPQEASVFRQLSVTQNIMAILETRKGLSKVDQRDKLEALLEELQITHIRDSLGISLSGTDHNVRETLGICDRAYILSQGKLIAEGKPEVVLANEQVKEVYLGENFSI